MRPAPTEQLELLLERLTTEHKASKRDRSRIGIKRSQDLAALCARVENLIVMVKHEYRLNMAHVKISNGEAISPGDDKYLQIYDYDKWQSLRSIIVISDEHDSTSD